MAVRAARKEGERQGDLLIGKYLLEDCLGIGGMGEVYRATNVSLDRKVAIKVLNKEHTANEDDVLRFLREARAAAAIRHPNVVDVLDVARDDDGTPFIVQELLSGEDLEQYLGSIREGLIPPKEALEIMMPVAEAVGAAHAKNVVHRDLKPANIFLAREGTRLIPKVLDFGACLYQTVGVLSAKEQRMLIGTPHYMAPEQITTAMDVDTRADIWALGVILYELVAGETPFEAADANAVMKLVRTRNVPRLRKLAPSASPMLEDLVMTCLDRDRRKRFENAGALHAALELVRVDLERGSRTKVDTLPEVEDLGPVKSGRAVSPPSKSASDGLPGTSTRLAAIALKQARPPTKRRRAALLTLSGPDDPVAWDEEVPPAPSSSARKLDAGPARADSPRKLDAGPARVDPRADAGSEPPKRPRTAADVIREAEAASASKAPALPRGAAAPPLPSGPSAARASSSAATSSRSGTSGASARAEPASARARDRDPRAAHDDLDLEPPPSSRHGGPVGDLDLEPPPPPPPSSRHGGPVGDLDLEPPSSRHGGPAGSLELESPPSPRQARPLPIQSSIPPVLDPRSAVAAGAGRLAASKSEDAPPAPEAPPRSLRGEAREASLDARPIATPASVRPPRPPAVPAAATPAAPDAPWSTRDKANLGLLIMGPALVAFVVLLFAPSVTAHLGHAMRGDTPLASGVLTVFTLVAAAALAARSLGASRSTPMVVATVGAVLLGIVMIIVTFSASETAESGISPAAASVVPFLAPLVPLALAIAAFRHARELWLSRYERREAITAAIVASLMVFAFLEVGPLGAVRRLGPPGASAPSGHAN